MIKFEFLVCAETLIKDPEKDTFSAINILEDILAESYPFLIPQFNVLLIASIIDEPSFTVKNCNFKILNNSNELHNSILVIDFKNKDKANAKVTVNGLPVKEKGKLVISFSCESQEISFTVNMKLRDKN